MHTQNTHPMARATRRAVLALAAAAQQAAWPDKAIRLVVPFPAGGPTDTASRVVGQKLAERLKQPVVVDNRAGASGSIAPAQIGQRIQQDYAKWGQMIREKGIAVD